MPLLAATQLQKHVELARQGHTLDQLGQSTADLTHVVKQSTDFLAASYGCKAACSSLTECRQQLWAQKTGKSTAAPKLCVLPPTTEAFEQNAYRAHFRVAQWYTALSLHSGHPATLNDVDYRWEVDKANNMAE